MLLKQGPSAQVGGVTRSALSILSVPVPRKATPSTPAAVRCRITPLAAAQEASRQPECSPEAVGEPSFVADRIGGAAPSVHLSGEEESSSSFEAFSSFDGALTLFMCSLLCSPEAMAAEESAGVVYNNSEANEVLKNAAGVAYVVLVGVFLYRLLKRRAKKSKSKKIAGQPAPLTGLFEEIRSKIAPNAEDFQKEATWVDAVLGAVQAGLLGAGLFFFSTKVSTALALQQLPDGYTARNISITVRTVILGLSWLATFVFCTNAVGLAGLSIQLLLYPDSVKEQEAELARRRAALAATPTLPRLSVKSNQEDMRRAFAEAERLGKLEASKKLEASRSSTDEAKASTDGSASESESSTEVVEVPAVAEKMTVEVAPETKKIDAQKEEDKQEQREKHESEKGREKELVTATASSSEPKA